MHEIRKRELGNIGKRQFFTTLPDWRRKQNLQREIIVIYWKYGKNMVRFGDDVPKAHWPKRFDKGGCPMKKARLFLTVLLLVSAILSGSGTELFSSARAADLSQTYQVKVHIDFLGNLIFSKYDVNMTCDGKTVGLLKHGKDADYELQLSSGSHTFVFTKAKDSDVSGELSVEISKDDSFTIEISCQSSKVNAELETPKATATPSPTRAAVSVKPAQPTPVQGWYKTTTDLFSADYQTAEGKENWKYIEAHVTYAGENGGVRYIFAESTLGSILLCHLDNISEDFPEVSDKTLRMYYYYEGWYEPSGCPFGTYVSYTELSGRGEHAILKDITWKDLEAAKQGITVEEYQAQLDAAQAAREAAARAAAPAPATRSNTGYSDTTVYITNSGEKYHNDGCRCLSKSKIPISLSEAEAQGYEPCSLCH